MTSVPFALSGTHSIVAAEICFSGKAVPRVSSFVFNLRQFQFETSIVNIAVVVLWPLFNIRMRCSSLVELLLMVQWVVGLIPHGRLIQLFLVPASAPQMV